jgi:hypothetical protein
VAKISTPFENHLSAASRVLIALSIEFAIEVTCGCLRRLIFFSLRKT